jgi:cytochrome c oxidase subunit II
MMRIISGPAMSANEPAGVQAVRIDDLFWSYFDVSALVFVLVSGMLLLAIVRRRRADSPEKRELSEEALIAKRRAIGAATAVTVITLVVLLVMSVATSRALASLGTKDAVTVEVVARKWWWEFQYPASVAGTHFTTAYEMHIPIGRPVEVKLVSRDVIHSFWVPSLHGKRDAIPGKNTTLVIQADRPGRYQGQCAEFCGTQHANMRFVVVAETEQEFKAWMARQLAPAVTPDDDVKLKGQDVFQKSRCVTCHAIGGTEAFATVGPNLTHVASRHELAMGTIPNSPGHLAGWIVDPQSTKPGTIMPGTPLAPDDLEALIAYLGSLK